MPKRKSVKKSVTNALVETDKPTNPKRRRVLKSKKVPEQVPEQVIELDPQQVREQVREQVPEEVQEQVQEQVREQVPEQVLEQVPEQVSNEVLEEAPKLFDLWAPPQFTRYLRTILSKLYEKNFSISGRGLLTTEFLMLNFGNVFMNVTQFHLESARKTTLQLKDMDICVRRTFELLAARSRVLGSVNGSVNGSVDGLTCILDTLVNSCLLAGSKAVLNVKENKAKKKSTKNISQAESAGITLPPVRIRRFAKEKKSNYRFSEEAIVFLSAVMESVVSRILELSKEVTSLKKRKRICSEYILSAVKKHEVLNVLVYSYSS